MTMIATMGSVLGWFTHKDPCAASRSGEQKLAVAMPVQLALRRNRTAAGSTLFISGVIKAVDDKGVIIEKKPCLQCSGYRQCGIDHGCLFAPYNAAEPNGLSMQVYAALPGKEPMRFMGKAQGIRQQGGREELRIVFNGGAYQTQMRIAKLATART